ncbi:MULTISPECIES: hypothetical protein [unclassified Corynebacterium]|uniref:hypothetical protein n=1 Tax=unclassified Corynebacterium TaxID=2624378 RepID=UPI0029C9F19D|nr:MULTISPECIES: hypothetical protein [unclassified Corynebacterium]WPF65534.1 hypothetical protein OLX12_08095 [Corynebacterium sp. 22KM0430]WPF68029.1 hypothetical protein OLW90_08090 [Corynebacterium sp. 21KM1197]
MTFPARYTSWGQRGSATPLLMEEGPEELGTFGVERATVGEQSWILHATKDQATATTEAGETFALAGNRARAKNLTADLGGRTVTFLNESRQDWVIEDAHGAKIAQFSGGNNGVRRCVLEVEEGAQVSTTEVVALSWFVRLILEARLRASSTVLIITLVAATLIAVLAILL